ncbi:MAG: DUF3578 domain-containing protein [Pyrinomonadaceae bacterium]|nr:DUF3578 domain-containing protein [Pyrinomonadaceae bacterium]
MIRDALKQIFEAYSKAKSEDFANHPVAHYIRHDVPELFRGYFQDQSDLIWDASPGKGKWVDAPWVAAFDPLVTETAQNGYYPVYLYTLSLDAVFYLLTKE